MKAHLSEYRAITRAFVMDVRTQFLSSWAFRVLVILKLEIGPIGIARFFGLREALNHVIPVWDPPTLEDRLELVRTDPELGRKPGVRFDAIEPALLELERAGFIRRDGTMLWVCDQLAGDPFYRSDNPKHRAMVQRYVERLDGSEPLVIAWCEEHRNWLSDSPTLSDSPPIGEPNLSDSHSTQDNKTQKSSRGAQLDKARQRWTLYNEHGLTRVLGAEALNDAVTKLVALGVWRTTEEGHVELALVKPWSVARVAKDSTDAVYRVDERLRSAA